MSGLGPGGTGTMVTAARKNRIGNGGRFFLFAFLVIASAHQLARADENHFEDTPTSSDDFSDFQVPGTDFFQIGTPEPRPSFTTEASFAPSRTLEMPRKAKSIPRGDDGKLKAPGIFARATFLYQAGFAPELPRAVNLANETPISRPTANDPKKTGFAQREVASVDSAETSPPAVEVMSFEGGPQTEEMTRKALAAEKRFEKTTRARRQVPGTYNKILSVLEGSPIVVDRIDSEEETMTPEERKAKRLARKTRVRKN